LADCVAALKTETLEAVADRGYFSSPEILACHEAGITVALPKPQTSGAKSDGRFGKQNFVRRKMPIAVRLGSNCHIALPVRKMAADKALLDHSLSKLFAQIAMHDGARAADSTMGA
jgi:hypothetical protein